MAKFKDFLEIEEGIWRQDFLYDIIGVVDDIGYTQRFQGSKKVQINFRLRDVSNNKICCTLWENYATQLITYMDEKTDAGGTIVCMKYAKIKPAGKFPLTVSNTWTTTKLFINDKILEILNFQKSLDEAISNGIMTTVVNTSSQLMSQSSGSSMYTLEQKFVQNHEIMPLSQMCCLTRDTTCVTVVKTVKVRSNNKGWYFQACYKCPKAVSGDKPPYKCGDNHPTETQIWKYRLDVDVKYENTESTFTFWDREVAQLLEVTAADLRDQCHDIGLTDPLDYPTTIDKIEGKTIAVRVKWQPKWKNGSVNEVHNGPDFIENLIDQFNGPTQDKKSAVPNDSAVSENNTPSKSITASLDVVIPMVSLSGTDEIDPEVVSMKTPSKRNGASILSCAENDETHELIASNASSTKMAKHQKME
ncbi:uncharacterized protein LOC123883644 isoform X1 [Trifolium pratense]|uniref:uncharacterized protein LOC123883644 isoform X1 n=2 Tax=Trifolium pratense TaxID=57577 RepID=UPI001E6922AF|nr:uncharacterized protein LOC123883644 isoform X1 [Trifolium pratense]